MMDKINRHINFMDAMKSERSFSGPDKKTIKTGSESRTVRLIFGTILQVTSLPGEVFPTDVHWFPKSIGAKKQPQSDVFVLTATDGKL